MASFSTQAETNDWRPQSGVITRYIDYSIFFLIFLYCNSIWVWPSDAQVSAGFQKPLGTLHQYLCFLGLFWALLAQGWRRWRLTKADYLLFAFIILISASVFWSIQRPFTVKAVLFFISFVFFAQYYVGKYGGKAVINQLILASTFVLCASVAAAIAGVNATMMAGIHEGLWRGFFVHKNPFGAFATFYTLLIIFAAGKLGYGVTTRAFMLALVAVVFVKASSSTAILGVAAAIALVTGVLTLRTLTRSAIFTWLFIVVFSGPVVFVLWEYFSDVLGVVGRDSTFSGRDRIWAYFLRLIDANGLLGTGYGTPYLPYAVASDAQGALFASLRSPHNGFLGVALNVGWLGTGLFAAWLTMNLMSAVSAVRVTKFGGFYLAVCGFSTLLPTMETAGWADISRGDFFFLYISSLVVGHEMAQRLRVNAGETS